jgi:hypothetical protein
LDSISDQVVVQAFNDFTIQERERKMKLKMKMCIAIGVTAILTGQTVVHAEEAEKPTAGVDLGLFSQYIWRGYELSKTIRMITASMRPTT